MRRAAKVDANQGDVVDALRAIGATVEPLHRVGSGCPDLLVGFRAVNYLLEVKDGSKPPSARVLTGDQRKWHACWNGRAHIVNSVDEALRAIGAIARGKDAVNAAIASGEITPADVDAALNIHARAEMVE